MINRRRSKTASHERWLVSYADFITLLFAFFVVLYASGQVDRNRVDALSVAIQSGFQELGAFSRPRNQSDNIVVANRADPSQSDWQVEIERALAKELAQKQVSIWTATDGLVISLREIGFFESGSAQLKPGAQATFAKVAAILRQHPHRLRIEGHTDNVPIHNARFSSNWELSTARATEVVRLLAADYGFPPERLSAAGYGEFHPVADNTLPDGRAANRRVDIVILSEAKHP
jgi:chemotaxis protein MotB